MAARLPGKTVLWHFSLNSGILFTGKCAKTMGRGCDAPKSAQKGTEFNGTPACWQLWLTRPPLSAGFSAAWLWLTFLR